MRKNLYLLFFLLFLCSSCSINGGFEGLYSYYSKTESKNPNLFYKPDNNESICTIKKHELKPQIIIINGIDIKKCMSTNKNSLIYLWSPKCKSKICYPLEIIQSFCNSKNIDLYVVAEYYNLEQMEVNYTISRPIFGVDVNYYKTSLTKKYIKKFLNDLESDSTTINRYFYFKNGSFVKSYESVYDLKN